MYIDFDDINLIRTFYYLQKYPGRANLSEFLNIGEGVMRRLLEILNNRDLILSSNKGHKYSEKGQKLIDEINKNIVIKNELELNLFKNKKNTAILLHDTSNTKINYILRDIAIRNQADGAMIFKYSDKLELPDCDYNLESFEILKDIFHFKKNDVLIVTFSDNKLISDISCFAVASKISESLKNI